jgi:outer membrane lipoprotein-sorting protein
MSPTLRSAAATLALAAGVLAGASTFPPALAQEAPSSQPAQEEDAAASPEVEAFLRAWAKAMDGVQTLRVEFTQTKRLKILRRPLVSQGVTLMRGRRVLMTVNGKDGRRETELLVDGKVARIHYPRQKRIEVYPLSAGGRPQSPFLLFGSDLLALPKTHRLRLEPTQAEGEHVLVLVPRDPSSPVKTTTMRFKDHTVVAMEQLTRRGDRLSLTVQAFVKNPEIPADALELSAGSDAQVVYPLGRD